MIKLNGKYDIGALDSIKCEIQIKKGLLNLIKKDSKLGSVTTPVDRKDYKIIRTNEEYGLPITHKYAIKFIDYNNKECYVYTDMWIITKWRIEIRKNKKINLWKILLWIITIILAAAITVLTEKKINSLHNKSSDTKTEQNNKQWKYNKKKQIKQNHPNYVPSACLVTIFISNNNH